MYAPVICIRGVIVFIIVCFSSVLQFINFGDTTVPNYDAIDTAVSDPIS